MPELPEVETTLKGVSPHVINQQVAKIIVRESRLRYPIPADLGKLLSGQVISDVRRRGKYLLFATANGHLLLHLGMSGSLRMVQTGSAHGKHDHVDLQLTSGLALRYTDPRRFGMMLWLTGDPLEHKLLKSLGPEPLSDNFSGSYLYRLSRGRKVPVKSFVMNANVVVGAGNIYANEALFLAGIRPLRQAGKLSKQECERLAAAIKAVLAEAIAKGGTTLRDFVGGDGKPGYFSQSLQVYGRGGENCLKCGSPLKALRIAQRATVYCPVCQR